MKNDTIYRNQIQNGIIQNTEIYKIIKQGEHNLSLWQQKHPLIVRNQSIRLEQFNRMKEVLKNKDNYDENIRVLQEIATITVKPIEIIKFTNEYKPILLPGADVGLGISGVIKTVGDTGIRVLETGTTLVKDVVSEGLNIVSGPIQIIIIAASVVGGIILLLIAYKYLHKQQLDKVEVNLVTNMQTYPHIWKHHDTYYKRNIQIK